MKKYIAFTAALACCALLCGIVFAGCSGGEIPSGGELRGEKTQSGMHEVSALDRFDYLTETYPAAVLLQSDPATAYPDGFSSYYFYALADEPLYDGELGGVNAEYLTDADRDMLGKDNYWYMVYAEDDLQKAVDDIWGEGVADVSAWPSDRDCLHAETGYFFVSGGMGDDGQTPFYLVKSVEVGDETATVTAYCVSFNAFSQQLCDLSSESEKIVASGVEQIRADMSFDEALAHAGVSPDELGTLDFIFYPADDGLRLQKVAPSAQREALS